MDEITKKLWLVASKLQGLAALIKNWNGEPLASNDDNLDGIHGHGMILADLANGVQKTLSALGRQRDDDIT